MAQTAYTDRLRNEARALNERFKDPALKLKQEMAELDDMLAQGLGIDAYLGSKTKEAA